jgi:hypothetical protein
MVKIQKILFMIWKQHSLCHSFSQDFVHFLVGIDETPKE